eukprot:m.283950 g.283950  ORF g.283950 m.283950 type:complete len:406 (+) comp17763_c1_seq11:662-1879(+)
MEAQELLDERLAQAANCEQRVNFLLQDGKIENILKFSKRIISEHAFLKGLSAETLDVKQLASTNLAHLEAILSLLERTTAIAVEKKVSARLLDPQTQKFRKVTCVVDVIAEDGNVWYRVTARKASALHLAFRGYCAYGFKGFHDQLQELVHVAEHHPNGTSWPKVRAVFSQGCTAELKAHIEGLGVQVTGQIVPAPILDDGESSDEGSTESADNTNADNLKHSSPPVPPIKQPELNLDVSAIIAYVSDVSHGRTDPTLFVDSHLERMAEEECREPVLPVLEAAMKDASLVTCETAWASFQHILSEIAGPRERERAAALQERIEVLPDAPYLAFDVVSDAKLSRSKVVFGTAMTRKIPTLTANKSFLRSAAEKGLKCAAIVHGGRALTETHKARWERRQSQQQTNT